jgi:hypothetical protein
MRCKPGAGRTGTWCAFEHGIEPDVLVASNALSGIGQPVAIILYDERPDVWAPGALGLFAGSPMLPPYLRLPGGWVDPLTSRQPFSTPPCRDRAMRPVANDGSPCH